MVYPKFSFLCIIYENTYYYGLLHNLIEKDFIKMKQMNRKLFYDSLYSVKRTYGRRIGSASPVKTFLSMK